MCKCSNATIEQTAVIDTVLFLKHFDVFSFITNAFFVSRDDLIEMETQLHSVNDSVHLLILSCNW